MYQSIYYERRKGNKDRGYFFLRDDEFGWKRFKHRSPVYEFDDEGEYTTLFGEKCPPHAPGMWGTEVCTALSTLFGRKKSATCFSHVADMGL